MRRLFAGDSGDDPAAADAYSAMTTAFLQSDQLITDIESGVAAARATDPTGQATQQWAPIREQHSAATATYLQLQRSEPDSPYQAASVYQECTRSLDRVCAEMIRFRDRFSDALGRARAVQQLAANASQQARADANAAVTALDRTENLPFLQYPSVIAAVDVLAGQVRTLDAVTNSADERDAAAAVTDAAAAVHALLAAAPGRGAEAQNAVRSIATRISAVATRADQLGPARSALLREFSAACSNDLVDNDRIAASAAAAAEQEVAAARGEIAAGRPEAALAHCASARDHLREADAAVDAVTDRLRSLREVRANPARTADTVRFRLRDAQQLAMQRDLVGEWGSVLDAQVDRIDRACAALDGVHPDYWTYTTDLEAIERFIVGVVDRMRGRG
ncbi:hypothetical protein ACFWPA_01585 [Rhodococcus sp. NPDC058505]|uniref:hypothetical protein n=1 Tax=unclassified Rhodococcus (in: high G+C Gram-positive bacteria) TaxID=192944 RepID=UPI003647701E